MYKVYTNRNNCRTVSYLKPGKRNKNKIKGFAYSRKFPKNSKYGTQLILGIRDTRLLRVTL